MIVYGEKRFLGQCASRDERGSRNTLCGHYTCGHFREVLAGYDWQFIGPIETHTRPQKIRKFTVMTGDL